MNGTTIENGEHSSVSRLGKPGDVIVESKKRHTIDLGMVTPVDKAGEAVGTPFRVFFGSAHDQGLIGAPQPTQELPPAVWRACLNKKAVQQMMSDGALRVIGAVPNG